MFKQFLILSICFFGIHFGAFAQNDDASNPPSYEAQIEQMTKQFQELFGQNGDLQIMIDTLHFDDLGDAFEPMQSEDFGKEFQQIFEQLEQQFQDGDFQKLFEGFEQFTIPAPENLEELPSNENEIKQKKKKKRKTYKI